MQKIKSIPDKSEYTEERLQQVAGSLEVSDNEKQKTLSENKTSINSRKIERLYKKAR